MIATVTHVTKDDPTGSWVGTAVYPTGVKPAALELYTVAYAGTGADMTGVQVIDEFGTMSGPIVLVPESLVGLAYDGALSLAFERDEGLAIGSGWPPVVIGLDVRRGAERMVAEDLAPLFRTPARRMPASIEVGTRFGGGAIGFAALHISDRSVEAFAIVVHDNVAEVARQVGVVVTDAQLGPRELRRLAASAHGALSPSLGAFVVAISVGDPIRYDPAQVTRRALDGLLLEVERARGLVRGASAAMVQARRAATSPGSPS
jgi:hypothetical protein